MAARLGLPLWGRRSAFMLDPNHLHHMSKQQLTAIYGALKMIIEADKFHLQVAKAILSPEPISEQQKAELRDQLARRESRHEQIERLLEEAKKTLDGLV